MTVTATTSVDTGPFPHQLVTMAPALRGAGERDPRSAAAVEHAAQAIVSARRSIVLREFGSAGSRAAATAAATLARGGQITVVCDMSMPSRIYGHLSEAEHLGEIRFLTPQKLRRPGTTIGDCAVLVVDLDSLACAGPGLEEQSFQIHAAAAAAERVIVTAHRYTRSLLASMDRLYSLGGSFTVIDLT